jgi:pyridoxal phosphate enzyme (YggS family)
MTTAPASDLASRIAGVKARVASAGRDPDQIRIVAVTKGFDGSVVRAAVAAGLCDLGENYAQDLLSKATAAPEGVRWHFLGPVQRNKVPRLAPLVCTWHAIDRAVAAAAVARAAPGTEVMIEVNLTADPGKAGCPPAAVDDLVSECRALPLDVSGLMTIGPAGDAEGSRRCFRWLADKARQLGLRELSMGMSDDFELAVAEGATTLRLGRVIFGPRPERASVRR